MMHLVIGPPMAGKTTYVREHARPGDVTIDYDSLTGVLSPENRNRRSDYPEHINYVTRQTRIAAIDAAWKVVDKTNVFVIHCTPSAAMLNFWRDRGAEIVTIDPGQGTVDARIALEAPWLHKVSAQWYEQRGAERWVPPKW